jgi:hypothetical protein
MKPFAAAFALFIVLCVGAALLPALAEQTPATPPAARQKAGDGSAIGSPANLQQKQFNPRNFRLAPQADHAPDALQEKQSAVTDEIGSARDNLFEPERTGAPVVSNAQRRPDNSAAIRMIPRPVDQDSSSQALSDDADDEQPD